MRWQSDKRVGAREAGNWSKHFESMEKEIDDLQARLFGVADQQVRAWTDTGEYVTGVQIAEAGLAELFDV
jgi:hypothetical protein